MYTSFFKLTYKPFQLTPDPEFLFMSSVHKQALTYLSYGINDNNTGFILVTGEVGTGKTTIIRSLMKNLRDDVRRLARIDNTKVTSEQLMSMINEDFGLDTKGRDKTQLLSDLTNFLIAEYAAGKRPMLIIDEAQNLSPDHLEEIRLLSNLETDKAKLLQILLVGQPELRKTLAQPGLRQLRQRINISCHIKPLTREETEEYIFHRLQVAGNREAVTFEEGVLEIVHRFSRGTPRLINIICDFLLLSAFVEKTTVLTRKLAEELTSQIEQENRYWQDDTQPRDFKTGAGPVKEILDRLDRLEIASYQWGAAGTGRKDIDTRFSVSLESMNNAINEFKTEMTTMNMINLKKVDERMNSFVKELETLRKRIDENGRGCVTTDMPSNGKKMSLWTRIFS